MLHSHPFLDFANKFIESDADLLFQEWCCVNIANERNRTKDKILFRDVWFGQ